jgi:hypothetical protein
VFSPSPHTHLQPVSRTLATTTPRSSLPDTPALDTPPRKTTEIDELLFFPHAEVLYTSLPHKSINNNNNNINNNNNNNNDNDDDNHNSNINNPTPPDTTTDNYATRPRNGRVDTSPRTVYLYVQDLFVFYSPKL